MSTCKIKLIKEIPGGFRSKGIEFELNKAVEVPAEFAGVVLLSIDEDYKKHWEIVEGQPVFKKRTPATLAAAVKRDEDFARLFQRVPSKALDGVEPLSEKAAMLVTGGKGKAMEAIAAGEVDSELSAVCMVLHMVRKADMAAACIKRAEALAETAAAGGAA